MNKEVVEIIGEDTGQFLDVDVEENGTVVGRYLRLKVRIDIRQPLRRGITMEIEEEGEEKRWCPLEYEFLPEFCYSCGVIGHTEKSCVVGSPTGESRQYNKDLRVVPRRRRFLGEFKTKQTGGGAKEPSNPRSHGDWRRDKEDRLHLGRGGGNHVGNKEELVNPSAVICDGREQAMVQKVEDVIEHMQSLHATIHMGNNTKESEGKMPATAKKGTVTYKRRPHTDKSEQILNSMTLEVGKKRGAQC
jgi:hypothetical protein